VSKLKVWVQFTRGGPCAVFPESDEQRARDTLGPSMSLVLFEETEPQGALVCDCGAPDTTPEHYQGCVIRRAADR
jgi:hypothetical protein